MNVKTLKLILGIVLALALVVGLYFGVKALTDDKGTPDPANTGYPETTGAADPDTTGAANPEATDATGAEATGEQEPEELDPEMAAALLKDSYIEEGLTAEDPRMDDVVAVCGDYTLTNRQAHLYYFMQLYSFLNDYGSYASYFGLDPAQPLKDQESMTPGMNWEQYFAAMAMDEFHQYAAVATEAKAQGHTLSQDQAEQLASIVPGLESEAKELGFADADAYIQDSFGPGVTIDTYTQYIQMYFQAMSYEQAHYEALLDSCDWTDQEMEDYLTEHAGDLGDYVPYPGGVLNTANVNVRHILFTFPDEDEDGTSTDEEKAAALANAQKILEEYQKNPTEDNFAELANANSEDPGSNTNGGLYEGVYPGQMVDTFNDWCFDPARKTGDTDIVETSYGYHVMYFVEQTEDLYWKNLAKTGYGTSNMSEWINGIVEAHPSTVDYSVLVLPHLDNNLDQPE